MAEKAVILTMELRFGGAEIWIQDLATPLFLLFDFDRHCPPLQNVDNCDIHWIIVNIHRKHREVKRTN